MSSLLHERRPRRRVARRSVLAVLECLESRQLLSSFTITSLADSGPGSFRQAILDSNANPGIDRIEFNTTGPTFPIFMPLSPLPAITDPTVIDGHSEPGYLDRPVITLNGSQAGQSATGLVLLAGQSTVQGLVITGFSDYGMIVAEGGGNLITGNYIGVDATGENAEPNANGGLLILGSSNNTVGIPGSGGGNVISGNGGDGIRIAGPVPVISQTPASGNKILANNIGVDSTGTRGVGNRGDGIHLIRASANVVGGTAFGIGNIVSSNTGSGIAIDGDSTSSPSSISGGFNRVQGNLIGTARNGTTQLGNGQDGIFLAASANSIGGIVAGAANLIAANGGNGVTVLGQNSPILSNAIFSNAKLGIDLGGSRANGSQTTPNILSVTQNGASTTVSASLIGTPLTAYTIQFFGNLAGESQGRVFVGTSLQTTDATGLVLFAVTIPTGVPVGGTVTATATSPEGNTSELSSTAPIAPSVAEVRLESDRTRLTLYFTTSIEPSRAKNPANYRVTTNTTIPIKAIALSLNGQSVTITLKKAIPVGTFAKVTIDPAGAPGLTSSTGILLDGNDDGRPGGTFVSQVAVGTKIVYIDAVGHKVTLQLAKGGSIAVDRGSNGNANVVRLYAAKSRKSVLSGTVKGTNATTPIRVLDGLNGAINKLTNPPFVIGTIAPGPVP